MRSDPTCLPSTLICLTYAGCFQRRSQVRGGLEGWAGCPAMPSSCSKHQTPHLYTSTQRPMGPYALVKFEITPAGDTNMSSDCPACCPVSQGPITFA